MNVLKRYSCGMLSRVGRRDIVAVVAALVVLAAAWVAAVAVSPETANAQAGVPVAAAPGDEQTTELSCPHVTATINYSKPFFKDKTTVESTETSSNIKLGTRIGLAAAPCEDSRGVTDLSKLVVGGEGTLTGLKSGNCDKVFATVTAKIDWYNVFDDKIGSSVIKYAAHGPIKDTVVPGGIVVGGDMFLGDDTLLNNAHTGEQKGACDAKEGLSSQTGHAQLVLKRYV